VRIREGDSPALDEHLAALRHRPALVARAAFALPPFFAHLTQAGIRDVREVKEVDVVSYLRCLQREPGRRGKLRSPATLRVCLSAIRAFFGFLEQRRLVLINPGRDLALPRVETLSRRVPSVAAVQKLMQVPFPGSALGLRDRAILETLYGTGIRSAECRRLDVADLAAQTLRVRDGKGRRDRLVPILGRALAALEVYLAAARPELARDSALFVSRRGTRLSHQGLERLVRLHGRAVNLELSPHSLRHACATHLLRGGADIRRVQQLLGHRRLDTTALYTRVEISDLAAVIARCHPREKLKSAQRNQP
jgi:integrase/recombinase XerD